MTKKILIIGIIIGILVLVVPVLADYYQSNDLNSNIAINSVKNFIQNSDENLKIVDTKTTYQTTYYIVHSNNAEYYIDESTGNVAVAFFFNSLNNSKNIQLSLSEGENIAYNYALVHYPQFSQKNMILTSENVYNYGDQGYEYEFIWNEIINKAKTPNLIVIDVNPQNGEIITYVGLDSVITIDIPQYPPISKEKAIEIAQQEAINSSMSPVSADLRVWYTKPNLQTLFWQIEFCGMDDEGNIEGAIVQIDAINGDIICYDPYL